MAFVEMLKFNSANVTSYNMFFLAATSNSSDEAAACLDSKINADIAEDLECILENNLRKIIAKYASYVDTIRGIIKDRGVTPEDLRSYLLSLSAFSTSSTGQTLALLCDKEIALKQCNTIAEVFSLLTTKCASFLDYEIFQNILDHYKISKDEEQLKYYEHLENFIKNHKVSEFIKVNPLLKKYANGSKKLVLKCDVEKTCRLAKVKEIKKFIAQILNLNPSALQIIDINDGCVAVTFLIPASVADAIFTPNTVLTPKQEEELRAKSVLQLECNGYTFDFRKEKKVPADSPGNLIVSLPL